MKISGFVTAMYAKVSSKVIHPLKEDWLVLRANPRALKPCRFPILMALVVSVGLLFVPQGQDLLLGLAEDFTNKNSSKGPCVFFILSAMVWAVFSWYWSRTMLYLKFMDMPENDEKLRRIRNYVPRLIGFAALLIIGIAFVKASFAYNSSLDPAMSRQIRVFAFATFAAAFLFLFIITNRRNWMSGTHDRLIKKSAPPLLIKLFDVPRSKDLKYGWYTIATLPFPVKVMTALSLAGTLCLFLIFVFDLQPAAPVIGAAAIALFAAAGWIVIGSLIDIAGLSFRVPALSILVGMAVLFSVWNDNHAVRTLPVRPDRRPTLDQALDDWFKRQEKRPAPNEPYPFFIAAAEGGGIRAAYWTATVLDKIQQDNPGFADQLFAISSVSGGSLGSAVFLARLADLPVDAEGMRYESVKKPAPDRLQPDRLVRRVLGEDFLAPVVGAMLYPDFVQRFLPFPVQRFDRARALEGAWERSWEKYSNNTRFSKPFSYLWRGKAGVWRPALFLNSTWVETGKRLIISNISVRPGDFNDAEDLIDLYHDESFPLSTAVHLSARFTYISPAGSLSRNGILYGRAVDGGYFENSGETTVLEILKTLNLKKWRHRVRPIVIHITNEPANPKFPETILGSEKKDKGSRPSPCMNEFLSPLLTLLNTRDARAVYAWKTVYWHVGGDENFLRFGLCRKKKLQIPLGWVLSEAVQSEIKNQLDCKCESKDKKVMFDNPKNLKVINLILRKRTGVL